MCNHYSSSGAWRDATGEFARLKLPVFTDRGRLNSVKEHVYPGRDGEILLVEDGQLVNAAAHWRFTPPYWRDSLKEWGKHARPPARPRGANCNNAKIEGLANPKSMFRGGARCLIPVDAFFEFNTLREKSEPAVEYRLSDPEGRVIWLAGLCAWAEPSDGRTFTFTMLTKEPGGDTASIKHHRQPVNLRPDQLERWLDPTAPAAEFKDVSPLGTFKVELGEKRQAERFSTPPAYGTTAQ